MNLRIHVNDNLNFEKNFLGKFKNFRNESTAQDNIDTYSLKCIYLHLTIDSGLAKAYRKLIA